MIASRSICNATRFLLPASMIATFIPTRLPPRDDRPGLKACLAYLKQSDSLVVWKLDRLGRSLPHLLSIVTDLKDRSVAFRSLTEQMDTKTAHGELLFSLFGALAQYERALTRERVIAGLAAANAEVGGAGARRRSMPR